VELDSEATQPIHGDLHVANVLFGRDGPVFLDFEDALSSWLPRSVDLAMGLERFVLAWAEDASVAMRLGRAFLEAYADEAGGLPFRRGGELADTLCWLAARALATLSSAAGQGAQMPEAEWDKFLFLFECTRTQRGLLEALGR
jgi:aminoglycoside phosphotransferase (APT) family kinase protein